MQQKYVDTAREGAYYTRMSTEQTASPATPFTLPTMDPMALWAESQAQFANMMSAALGRWQSVGEQYTSVEARATTHAQHAVANWAQLAKEAIAYAGQLATEARKLSLEAAKKMGVSA